MRTVRAMGTFTDRFGVPTAVDWLPFQVQRITTTPTGTGAGSWYYADDTVAPAGMQIFCVDRADLVAYFGRHRMWDTTMNIAGTYYPGAPMGYTITRSHSPAVDVVTGVHPINEQFLPHGRSIFISEDLSPAQTGYTDLSCSFRSGLTATRLIPILEPGNIINPFQLYDEDPSSPPNYQAPLVYWYAEDDAWFIRPACSVLLAFGDTGTPGSGYFMGWTAGIIPDPPLTQDLGGGQVANDYIDGGSAVIQPFPNIPGYFWGPGSGTNATPGSVTLNAVTPGTDGYFEFRDSDGNNPVWDKDNGDQLITPVPPRIS